MTTKVETEFAEASSAERNAVDLAARLRAEQLESLFLNNELARREFELAQPAFRKLGKIQKARGELLPFSEMRRILMDELDAQARLDEVRDEVLKVHDSILQSGNDATPTQIAAIQRAADVAEDAGHMNLLRAASGTKDLIAAKLRSDEDFDRGGGFASEAARQRRQLGRTIGAARTEQQLLHPLKANPILAAQANAALGVGQSGVTFDQARRTQDLANSQSLLGLAGQAIQNAGQTAASAAAGQTAIAGELAAQRRRESTTTTTPGLLALAAGPIAGAGGFLARKLFP